MPPVHVTLGPRHALLAAGAAVALAATVYAFVLAGGDAPSTPSPTVADEPTTTDKAPGIVVALGRIEPFNHVRTIVPVTGTDQARLATLNVKEGDEVKAGQVLATLDTAARQLAAVDVAQANLQQAQSALDRTRVDAANAITVDNALLQRWLTQGAKAKEDFDRAVGLAKDGFGTRVDARSAEIVRAQVEQQLLQAAVNLARANAKGSSGKLLDVEAAEAQVESAKAQLSQARASFQETQVQAPSDGQVLRVYARVGERVGDHGLMSFGQTSSMAVRTEVYATEIGRIALGASATVTTPALPAPLHGTVAEITPMIEAQSIVTADPTADTDARIVQVRVRLDPASSRIAQALTNLEVRVSIAAGRPAETAPSLVLSRVQP